MVLGSVCAESTAQSRHQQLQYNPFMTNLISALNGNGSFRKRRMSAAGRARIAAAQRARWAKVKGRKILSIAAHEGRTMSPAARRKIAAAQKARWAKWRKAQKSA